MTTKTALITGASRGIGKAIAYTLADNGYDLYLICRNSADELKSIAKDIEDSSGMHCECFIGDVSDPSFIKEVFSSIPSLDVLVNNAGISHVGLLQDMTDEEWDKVIATNLSSPFYTSREALKLMLPVKAGKIINISSVWGERGAACEAAYSASKGGLNSLTKALAKEVAVSGIQVNAISCGFIDTDMNSYLNIEERENIKDEIPADTFGKPEDVASLVLNIINSPDYMTGQVIGLDGGWM